MSYVLNKYLDRVMVYANCKENKVSDIRTELEDHLHKKIEDLQKEGFTKEDAIYKAIDDHGHPRTVGYGLRPKNTWLDVRSHGTARGFIAVGPKAVGVVAMGGQAYGIFAFGGFSVGLISFGGFALSLLFAWGGFAATMLGVAYGGFALAPIAVGGFAAGIISTGGVAYGLYVPGGGQVHSLYTLETLPSFLKWIWSYSESFIMDFTDVNQYISANKILVFVFLFLLFPMLYLQKKEMNRIQKQDPYLAE